MGNQANLKYRIDYQIDQSSFNKALKSLQDLQKAARQQSLSTGMTDELKQTIDLASKVQQALKAAYNPKLGSTDITKFNAELDKQLGITVSLSDSLYNSFSKLGISGKNAFTDLQTSIKRVQVTAKESHKILDTIADTFMKTARWSLSSSVVHNFTNSIRQAYNYTKALDSSLNDIRIVTGKSKESMSEFAKEANKAAQQLGISTTAYTDASLIYYQQGLAENEVKARTEITAKVANVTRQSADKVSEQLTAIWNGYKVSAEEAEIYIDRLSAIAANSASNLEELATGMSKVASAAAALGVNENQLAAMLSTIESVTRQAPESVGTALRTVFARISDIEAGLDGDTTLGNYSAEMSKLGINVLDTNNKLRNMGDVIEEIGGKWASMTREQQINLAQTMAGQRQYSNVVALFDNFNQYNKMIQVAEDSIGTLNEQQDIYLDRTTAKMQKLNAALEGVWDSLIDQGDVKSILDPLTKVANIIENIIDSIGGGRGAFKDLTALLMLLMSRKASEGIGNFMINRSKEKQYQKDFEYKIQQDQEIINSKTINEDQKQLARARIELHKKAPNMNKQEYDYHLKRIDEMAQATKEKRTSDENVKAKDIEIAAAQEKLRLAEQKKNSTEKAYNDAGSLLNKLTDEQGKKIKTIIKTREEAVEKFKLFLIEQGYATREELEAITDYQQVIEEKDKILQQIKEKGSIGEKYLSGVKVTRESVKNKSIPIGSLVDLAKSELDTFDGNMDALGASSQDKEKALQKKGVIKRAITQYNNIKRKHEEQWIEKAPSLDEKEKAELIEKQNKDFKKIQTMLTNAYLDMLDQIVEIAQKKAKGETGNQVKRAERNADMLEKQFQHYNEVAGQMAEEMEDLGLDVTKVTQQMMDGVTEVQKTKEAVDKAKEDVEKLKNEKKDLEGNSKQAETDRKTKTHIFYGGMSDKDKAEAIQGLLEIAGTYEILQASASQAFNVISIGFDKSLTFEQKMGQWLTNIVSTFGMAIPAAKKFFKTINTISEKVKTLTITGKDGQQRKIGETISKNLLPVGGAIAAVGIFKTIYEGINSARSAYYKSRLQSIEQDKKQAQERKASNQTILDSVTSLEELNNQYNEGTITKAEFITKSEEIIQANNLEKQGIDKLTSSYQKNKKALQDLKIEKLKDQLDQQQKIVGSTSQINAIAKMASAQESLWTDWFSTAGDLITYMHGDKLALNISEGFTSGRTLEQFDLSSPQNFIKSYEDYLDRFNNLSEKEQQAQAVSNARIKELLNEKYQEMKKSIEEQKALISQVSVQEALTQNLEVTDFQDYDALINSAVAKAKKHYQEDSDLEWSDEAKEKVIKDVRTKFAGNKQVMAYEGFKKYLDKNTHLDRNNAISYFNQLTSDQKEHFVDFISQNQINDAEHLKTIFEQIRDMDFTSEMARVNTVNLEELKSLAAEDYLLYKGIEEQVENGKNLSKTEYEKLNEEVQKFFTMSANGTYQFTGNVNEFKEAVRQFQTASTLDLRDQINNRINQLNDLLQQARNFGGGPEAYSDYIFEGKINDKEIDYSDKVQMDKLTKARVDYLAANGDEQGIIWKKAIENGLRLTPEEEGQIKQIISTTQKFVYDKVQQEAEILAQKLPQVTTMLFRQLIPVDSDVDSGQLNNFTNMLQQVADAMDEFSDGLETNRKAAELTAQALLRYNSAAQSWMKNYQHWSETLNSNNLIEFSKIAPQLRNVYSDLLGITGDDLSNKFLASKTNFAELQKALTGTEEEAEAAYNALMKLAAEDINAKFNFEAQDLTGLQTLVDEFNAYFNDEEHSLEARVNFDDSEALQELERFANKYGMTAQQIRDYALANYGIDLEVNQVAPEKTTETIYGYNTVARPVAVPGVLPNVGGTEEQNMIAGVNAEVIPVGTQITSNVSSPVRAVKVISGGKAVGGKTKYNMATATSKKLSGSSSKSYSKKQNNKKPDIYHDVNTRLDQSKRRLQRTQDKESKLIGKDLVKNLNDQMILYRQQKNILEEKLKLQKQDLANQRKVLEQLGVQFDAYGNISNYVTILQTKNKRINELIARRNALIDNGNEASQKQVDALDKQIAEEEASYSKYESLMNAYTTDNNSIEDTKDAIQQQTQKQIEIRIKKAKMKVEIPLDLHNAKKEWLNFVRNTINRDSLLKTTNLEKIIKDANLAMQLVSDKSLKSSAEGVTKGFKEVIEAYNQMQATGTSDLFGNDYGKLQERLKQLMSQGMTIYEDIAEATEMMEQAVLDAINAVSEAFEEQAEKLQFLNNQYSKSIDLVKLLYGEKSYDAIMKFQNQQFGTDLQLIDLYKKEAEDAKTEYEKAMAEKDTEKAKKWQQIWRQASENVTSYTYEAAKKAQEARDTANEKAADAFEKSLTSGEGFDYLTQRWNQIKEDSKEYLDTVNRAYQVSSVERKYKDAINGTTSVKNQRELNKLMDAEMTKLKEKDKLSKYDVERAVKMLDIKKAEMALQDARMSKTSMRLKRDSQGNYSYEYVADTSKINDAEQNLAKAKNDLYNFDLNHYQQIYDKILGAYKDYAQKIIEIENNTELTEKQKQERKDELYKNTSERIKGYAQDYNTTTVNLTQSAVDSIEGIQAEQEKKWVEQHVPGMNAASQSVIDKLIGKEGSDEDSIKKAFEDLDKQVKTNTKNYNNKLKEVEKQSGISFTNISKGINPVAQAYQNVITDNDTLAKNIIDKYKEVEEQKTVFDAYLDKMNPVSEKLKTLMKQALALQQTIGKINTNALKSDDGKGSGKTGEKYNINKTPAPSITDTTKTDGDGNTGNGNKPSLEGLFKGNTPKPEPEPTTIKDILVSGGKAAIAALQASGIDKKFKGMLDNAKSPKSPVENKKLNFKMSLQDIINSKGTSYSDDRERLKKLYNQYSELFSTNGQKPKYDKIGVPTNLTENWTPLLIQLADRYIIPHDPFDLRQVAGEAKNTSHPVQKTKQHLMNQNLSRKELKEKLSRLNINQDTKNILNTILNEDEKEWSYIGFDTGGYTGIWHSQQGKLAMLHEKELVLNKKDTENMLKMLEVSRAFNLEMAINKYTSRLESLNSKNQMNNIARNVQRIRENLEQMVTIQASFPAVNSRLEIEEALKDLINITSQKIMSKK